MVKSQYNTYDDFTKELSKLNKFNRLNKHSDKAYIILSNPKIPWSWYSEKLTQLLYWNLSGGMTGAGTGHHVFFENDLHQGLANAKNLKYNYAMVCQVGMILNGRHADQIKEKTPIQNFYEFSETDEFCRAHILARPNKPATIHTQHLEINLLKWNGQTLTELGIDYVRSDKNIHDDYTPLWIEVPNYPRINNFLPEQRQHKFFTYPHRNYENDEYVLHNHLHNKSDLKGHTYNYKLTNLLNYVPQYYFINNENLQNPDHEKYDIIFTPASGIFAEYFYKYFAHKETKTIIYDYDQYILDIKRNILDFGLSSYDELEMYKKHLNKINSTYIYNLDGRLNASSAKINNEKIIPLEQRKELQDNFLKSDYEFMVMDLLNDNFTSLENLIKNKKVLFFSSNIFRYIGVWLKFDYSHIRSQRIKLENTLEKYSSEYKHYGKI